LRQTTVLFRFAVVVDGTKVVVLAVACSMLWKLLWLSCSIDVLNAGLMFHIYPIPIEQHAVVWNDVAVAVAADRKSVV
jgi:hypothetical protein